jgi:hypothetical protein
VGALTSRQLTREYLERIAKLNPLLAGVIETNPDALAIAARLDAERRGGRVRGPLHGIPVLVKDNIATDDQMQTTAGSLALVGSQVPSDSIIVSRKALSPPSEAKRAISALSFTRSADCVVRTLQRLERARCLTAILIAWISIHAGRALVPGPRRPRTLCGGGRHRDRRLGRLPIWQ